MNSTKIKLEVKMQKLVNSLSIPMRVVWSPDQKAKCHGEIANGCIVIYDVDEGEVWDTFIHEMLEYKLKKVTSVYLETINALMDTIQKVAYAEKELFIESIPILVSAVRNAQLCSLATEDT